MTEIDPRDPNVRLWQLLLSGGARGVSRPVTPETREKMRKSSLAYYAKNTHHAADPDVVSNLDYIPSEDTRPVLALCLVCNGPLYELRFAKIGIGEYCLKNGIATGRITLNPDGSYTVRKRRKPKGK